MNSVTKTVKIMLEKPIGKCLVCDTPFTHRKGKLYCSNTCKQKAHINNTANLNSRLNTDSENANKYSLGEYIKYVSECGRYSLVHYLFLRKNLSPVATTAEIEIYINGLYEDLSFEQNLNNSEPFKRFQLEFFENKYSLVCDNSWLDTN